MNADSIQYALETDWPVEAAGFEPLHQKFVFPLASLLSCLARARAYWKSGARSAVTLCAAR